MITRLKALQAKFPAIGEVRGLGSMVAIELVKNRRADQPDAELTRALVQAAAARGLVILSCGVYGNVIRFLAPLTIRSRCSTKASPAGGGVRRRRRRADGRDRLTLRGAPRPAAPAWLRRAVRQSDSRLQSAVQARPALASVGAWKYSLSEAS